MRVSSVQGHVIVDSEEDIIFRAGGVERARIDENGNFTGTCKGTYKRIDQIVPSLTPGCP